MKTAAEPFQFQTASYITRVGNQKAADLAQFLDGLEQCSDASIFYHTYQSLGRHHFLTEGFSNDFAQWVLAACNRNELAEALAALDVRDYVSLADLRNDLCKRVAEHCRVYPNHASITAFEPFYFCEAIEVTVPLGIEARNLSEFREALVHLGHDSFNFHFISSRLRLHLRTNDFSFWFEKSLGLKRLAERTNRIDIYTNTIESAQHILLDLVAAEADA
jgi:uncharacterized protein DUF5752